MHDKRQELDTSQSTASLPTGWRSISLFLLVFCCISVGASAARALWSGQNIRPLLLVGQMTWMLTIMGLIGRRMLRKQTDVLFRWYRFSLTEMFVIATGFAVFAGFSGADYRQRRAEVRHHEQLQQNVSQVLGPEGRLGFESDGSLSIFVCDRTFDDKRLAELAKLIHDDADSYGVSRVLFGTGSQTAGIPPQWSGITDASVEILLQWQGIEMLSIEGTSISAEGRKQLLSLEELDDWSRNTLVLE